MQGVHAAVDPRPAGGARSGPVGPERLVRLLACVLLLGGAVLIVALVGEGVAAARPGATQGGEVQVDPDLARSRLAAAKVFTQPAPPSPAETTGLPQRMPAPDGHRTDGSAVVPDLRGLGWQQDEPEVVARSGLEGDQDRDTPGGGVTPAGAAASGTVAQLTSQAQPPATPDPRGYVGSLMISPVMDELIRQTAELTGLIDRTASIAQLTPAGSGPQPAELQQSIQTQAKMAKDIGPSYYIPNATREARTPITAAVADLRKLVAVARQVALDADTKLGPEDERLRSAAQLTAKRADDAQREAAYALGATPPKVLPKPVKSDGTSVSRSPVPVVVRNVLAEVRSLAEQTSAVERWFDPAVRETRTDGLLRSATTHTEAAEEYTVTAPLSAQEQMDATIADLRELSGVAHDLADKLSRMPPELLMPGTPLRDAANTAAGFADFIEGQLRPPGTQPSPPSPKGGGLMPQDPVIQDADADEPGSGTTVAAEAGGRDLPAQPSGVRTPTVEASTGQTPVLQSSDVGTPVVQTSDIQTPTVEASTVDKLVADTPAADTPVVEASAADTDSLTFGGALLGA